MPNKEPFWEDSYKRPGKMDTFGGGKPNEMVVRIAKALKPGAKVLDLGCGEGRNAIYLAQSGFNVTAFDISVAGIGKLLTVAREKLLKINAFVADMREYEYTQPFEMIVCVGCLHLIKREEWHPVIKKMKENTVRSGWNLVGVLTDTVPEPEDLRGWMTGLFKEGELAEQYHDWDIIERREYTFHDRHPNGFAHDHAANEVIAKKPG